jgi:hypothetical protein
MLGIAAETSIFQILVVIPHSFLLSAHLFGVGSAFHDHSGTQTEGKATSQAPLALC